MPSGKLTNHNQIPNNKFKLLVGVVGLLLGTMSSNIADANSENRKTTQGQQKEQGLVLFTPEEISNRLRSASFENPVPVVSNDPFGYYEVDEEGNIIPNNPRSFLFRDPEKRYVEIQNLDRAYTAMVPIFNPSEEKFLAITATHSVLSAVTPDTTNPTGAEYYMPEVITIVPKNGFTTLATKEQGLNLAEYFNTDNFRIVYVGDIAFILTVNTIPDVLEYLESLEPFLLTEEELRNRYVDIVFNFIRYPESDLPIEGEEERIRLRAFRELDRIRASAFPSCSIYSRFRDTPNCLPALSSLSALEDENRTVPGASGTPVSKKTEATFVTPGVLSGYTTFPQELSCNNNTLQVCLNRINALYESGVFDEDMYKQLKILVIEYAENIPEGEDSQEEEFLKFYREIENILKKANLSTKVIISEVLTKERVEELKEQLYQLLKEETSLS